MKLKSNPFLRYSLALAASSAFLSMGSALAATYDWTGATDSNFTNGANWVGGIWTQWDDYRFGGTPTNTAITINGYFGIGSLTLQSGLTTDIVINSSNANPVIMHTGIANSGLALISIDANSSNLTINGEYIAASAVTWDVGAGRTLTINGQLNNWSGNGAASLVKNGAGTAVLTGANGYTGATTVNNGLLQVGTQNGLSSSSAITVASGATLSMTAASNNTLTVNTGLTLNGGTLSSGGGSAVTNYGNFHLGNSGSISVGNDTGTSNITGNLSVDGRDLYNDNGGFSAITVGDNSTLAISGNVTGVSGVSWGGVSKYGNGTLKLTGTGDYAQGMYLAAGTVEFEENGLGLRNAGSPHEGYAADFAGNATLRWATGNTQDLSGNGGNGTYSASQMKIGDGITATLDTNGNDVTLGTAFTLGGSQTGALTKAGAGTLTLTAANSYTGTTTISAGTLQIGNGGSTGSLYSPSVSSGNLTFGSSGAIVNNGALVYNIAGGSVNVNKTISGTGTVSVTGDQSVNFADGTAISTDGSQTYSATATGNRYYGFNLADNATVTLTSTAGNISMTGMLGTANSNTGNLVINTSAGNGNVTLNTPAGVPGVDYGLNALTVTAGTGTINLGTHNTQDWYNVTTLSLTGGAINSTANMVQFTTLTVNNSDASAFSGNLTASGGALVKEGAGILTLSGDNSYSGGTTINEGTLVATRGKLGTGAVVINDGGTLLANDQWVLNSTNPYGVTERNIGSLTINAGGTLQLDNTNGFVNGVANLYLNGGLVTGGPNDLRGDLFLYNGNQQITAGGTTTSTIASVIGVTGNNNTITVGAGSTLDITAGIKNSDWNGNGTTPGGIIKAGTGTLTLTAANTYSGTTEVSGGTLALQNTYASSGFAIGTGATLELNVDSGSRDLASTTFSGAGTLTKTGAGDVVWAVGSATFALGAGSWIDVQEGVFGGGSNANENWSSNLAGLNVASGAIFNGVEANVRVDALTGAGTITSGYPGAGYENFTFGVNNGSGTFSGSLTDSDTASANFVKAGSGTQTLTGTLDYNGTTTVSGGTLELPGGDWKTGGRYSGGTGASGTIIVGAGATLSTSSGVTGLQNGLVVNGGTVSSRGLDYSNYRNLLLESNITAGGAATSTISSEISLAGDREIAVGTDSTLNITGGIANDGFFGGSQGITKTGDGTLKLSGTNTYTGTTTVSGGKLVVNGSTSTGAVTVASGATLGGSGTIGGTAAVTGILAPGNAGVSGGIGTLTAGTTTWNGAASSAPETIWQFDLSATSSASDTLAINGNFNGDSTVGTVYKFNFMNSAPTTWGNVYTLLTWTGTTNFTNANQFSWTNLGGAFDGAPGTGFTLNANSLTFTAVPEPTSALAGLLIAAGLLRRRR